MNDQIKTKLALVGLTIAGSVITYLCTTVSSQYAKAADLKELEHKALTIEKTIELKFKYIESHIADIRDDIRSIKESKTRGR